MKTGYDLLLWKYGGSRACGIGLFSKVDLLIFIAYSVWHESVTLGIEHMNSACGMSLEIRQCAIWSVGRDQYLGGTFCRFSSDHEIKV